MIDLVAGQAVQNHQLELLTGSNLRKQDLVRHEVPPLSPELILCIAAFSEQVGLFMFRLPASTSKMLQNLDYTANSVTYDCIAAQ